MDRYQGAAAYADRIEQELRAMDVWRQEPLPASAFESHKAFCADTMTFFQWLQFVLLARIRETVAEGGTFPSQSQVGRYAVRELDGLYEAGELVTLLSEFDDYIENGAPLPDDFAPALAPPAPVPVPPPEPSEPAPPREVVEQYWRTRDPHWLVAQPSPHAGMDVQLAERVFRSATAFLEFAGDTHAVADGAAVDAVVRAERGDWVVRTILRRDPHEWRIDIPLSVRYTALMFLYQHHIHPPYTEVDDARGRAMQFWQAMANYDDRRARPLALDPAVEIPRLGDGQIDEFFWYVSHSEEGGSATVRVLMNTHRESRVWNTRMVERGGVWYVDVAATLSMGC